MMSDAANCSLELAKPSLVHLARAPRPLVFATQRQTDLAPLTPSPTTGLPTPPPALGAPLLSFYVGSDDRP